MGRFFLVCLLVATGVMQVAGQEDSVKEDENRPYQFAFNIEGYQHRSEEKDNDGIIMGEFGFVTGDGIYHVTVYATDKDGDFKILSMKSYYVGLPGEPTTTQSPPSPTTTQYPRSPTTKKHAILQHLDGLKGCSNCIIPSKETASPLMPEKPQTSFKTPTGSTERINAQQQAKPPIGSNLASGKPAFTSSVGPQTSFKTPTGGITGKKPPNVSNIPTVAMSTPSSIHPPFSGEIPLEIMKHL